MTHEEIRSRELVEAYIRRQLGEPERTAVEDHLFECDVCFADAESLQRFVEGVRDAVESGKLPAVEEPRQARFPVWFRPAFVSSMAASMAFAAATMWAVFVEIPHLRRDAAAERQAKQSQVTRLEQELAVLRQAPVPSPLAQANVPLLMLEEKRDSAVPAIQIPRGAETLILWLEPAAGPANASYRLDVSASGGAVVETLDGLRRNPYGAMAVSIPAARLAPGVYRARLILTRGGTATLAADYRFEVRR